MHRTSSTHPIILTLALALLMGCPRYVDPIDDNDATAANDDDATSEDPDLWWQNDDDTIEGCTDHPDCEDDEFCHANECEQIWDRTFNISVIDASISEAGPDGSWDPFGGLPDPYVVVSWNDDFILSTPLVEDTLSPTWNETTRQVISSGGELCFFVFDSDLDEDDVIDGACWAGNDGVAAMVRLGEYDADLYDGRASLHVTVLPDF